MTLLSNPTLSAENPVEILRSQSASMLDIGLVRANRQLSDAWGTLNQSFNANYTGKRVKTYWGGEARIADDGLIEIFVLVDVEGMINESVCEKHIMHLHHLAKANLNNWFASSDTTNSIPVNLRDSIRIVCVVYGDDSNIVTSDMLVSDDKPKTVSSE
jgi:hypothetical protein